MQNGGNHILSKDTCTASNFVRQKDVIKLFEKDSHLMLGHTRQATQGTINAKNAHPFEKETIVGVHNGVIMNDDDVAKKHDFKIEVDSEVIFELLNKYENDFVKTFKEIRGSASVAWVNTQEANTLYLLAHENPLAVAEVPMLKTVFFASEFVALDSILSGAIGTENYSIWDLEQDTVYKLSPEHKFEKTKVDFAEFSYGSQWEGKKWDSDKREWVDKDDKETKLLKSDEDLDDWDSGRENLIKNTDNILEAEEVDFIKEICRKSGCNECKAPLNKYCYYDDDISDVLCYKCIEDDKQLPYVYVNLENGSTHYIL